MFEADSHRRIASIGLALPAFEIDQKGAYEFLHARFGEALGERVRRAMRKIFAHPSVRRRRFAIDAPDRLVAEDPDARIDRFTRSAVDLSACDLARGSGGAVASVSVEVCSATFRMGDDLGLIVSNAIFGDGAAAAIVRGGSGGLAILASASRHAPEHREAIRYVYRGGQLWNQLAPDLPARAAGTVVEAVGDALRAAGPVPVGAR